MELVELHELCARKPDDAHECKSETKFAGRFMWHVHNATGKSRKNKRGLSRKSSNGHYKKFKIKSAVNGKFHHFRWASGANLSHPLPVQKIVHLPSKKCYSCLHIQMRGIPALRPFALTTKCIRLINKANLHTQSQDMCKSSMYPYLWATRPINHAECFGHFSCTSHTRLHSNMHRQFSDTVRLCQPLSLSLPVECATLVTETGDIFIEPALKLIEEINIAYFWAKLCIKIMFDW